MSQTPFVQHPSSHNTQESKVVKHNYKIFTSTARKEQKEQSRSSTLQGHPGSPTMSTSSNRSGQITPSPSPRLSPIESEAKVVSESGGDSSNGTPPSVPPANSVKPRYNPGLNGQNRSASFSYAPSYNSYHKGYQPRVFGGGYSNLRNNATGVSNCRPENQPSESRASPDSSGRPGSSNSSRVASLTGTNLRSGANSRGGRRGGYNSRFQSRHQMQPNLSSSYPRYPGAQFMLPVPYSYYPSALPVAVPPQPGTALLVPDVNCRCYDCVTYFANMNSYYPSLLSQPQVVPQQQNSQVGDNLQLVPAGQYLQPQLGPTFIPYYGSYPGQQQALMYQQQQQVNILPMQTGQTGLSMQTGQTGVSMQQTSLPMQMQTGQTGVSMQTGQTRNPEPKNELTPIEAPGSVPVPASYGDGYYFSAQTPYVVGQIQNQGAGNYDSLNNGQQSFNPQPQLGQGNGLPGNTFSYTLVDRVQNNSSVQSLQLKH